MRSTRKVIYTGVAFSLGFIFLISVLLFELIAHVRGRILIPEISLSTAAIVSALILIFIIAGVIIYFREASRLIATEEKLSESEKRLNLLIEHIPEKIFTSDPDGNLTEYGNISDNSSEQTLFRLFPQEQSRKLLKLLQESLNSEEAVSNSLKIGEEYFEFKARHLPEDVSENSHLILLTQQNITQHQIREDSLNRIREHLELSLKGARLGLWEMDLKTGKINFDDTYSKRFNGGNETHLTLEVVEEMVHPEDRAMLQQAFYKIQNGLSDSFETEYRIKGSEEGQWRWIFSLAEVTHYDQDGQPLKLSGTNQIITARKESELKLIESNTTLQTILDAAPSRIFWKDLKLRYLGCNTRFARDLGFDSPSEIIGLSDFDLPWAENQAASIRKEEQLLVKTDQSRWGSEKPLFIDQTTGKWISISRTPLINSQAESIGIIGAYEDITELRRVKKPVKKEPPIQSSERDTDDLATKTAQLLKALSSELSEIESSCKSILPPDKKDLLLEESQVLAELASCLEVSKQSPVIITVSDIISNVADLLNQNFSDKIRLVFHPPANEYLVKTDKNSIQQAICNLAFSLYKKHKNKITLHVKILKKKNSNLIGFLIIESRMPPEKDLKCTERLIETKDIYQLAASLIINKAHGIIRTAINSESALLVELPEFLNEPETEGEFRGKTVLFAEDEEIVQRLGIKILKKTGLKVYAANNGEEAISIFKNHQDEIDLLIMDVLMPRKNGRAAYDAIRKIKNNIPVIFCSGYSEEILRETYLLEISGKLVLKPYNSDLLINEIKDVFSKYHG